MFCIKPFLRNHWLVILLFVIGLSVVMGYSKGYVLPPDGVLYSNMANNLLQGKGLVNTVRNHDYVVGPIYPLFLALVYSVFGIDNYQSVITIQSLILALTLVLIFKIAEKLKGKAFGILVFLLTALFIPLLFWNRYILTETLFTFLLTLFIYLLICYQVAKGRGSLHTIALGIVLGLCHLTRPLLIMFYPILLVWLISIHGWKSKITVKHFLIITVISLLILSPWTIRNYIKYHQVIVVTNYGAYELYCGNNPNTDTKHFFDPDTYITWDPSAVERIQKLPWPEQEKEFSTLAKSYIISHPVKFVYNTIHKEFLFWYPVLFKKVDALFILLGLIGLGISLLQFGKYGVIVLTISYYSLVVSAITVVPFGRYRLPIMPLMIIFSSLALYQGAILVVGLVKPKIVAITH